MKRAFVLLPLLALAYACGGKETTTLPPTGQIVLYVSTDAPLPPPDGVALAPTDVPPLFDRLRIELYAPSTTTPCRDCTREFSVDRDLIKNGQASFGFVPPPDKSGYLAKVQLYRAIAVEQGVPIPNGAITRVVALPKVAKDGIVEVGVTLHVAEVGQVKGTLDAPTVADEGKPDFGIVGTWSGATRVPCKGKPGPGEACVPGGAYWMGDPTRGASLPRDDWSIPRLVVLTPYFIDLTEVTVAQFRAANIARIDPATKMSEDPYEAEDRGTLAEYNKDNFGPCTFTQTPGVKHAVARTSYDACGIPGNLIDIPDPPPSDDDYAASPTNRNTDALPVTCVSWAKATQYCRALGKDLPTQAQVEYLAGGFASHRYPWGDQVPGCDDAVLNRYQSQDAPCLAPGGLASPLPPGSGKLDRVKLDGGEVVDIAGNVKEIVRDVWNRPTESCWTPPLLENPVCSTPTVADALPDTCAQHTDPVWGAAPIAEDVPYTVNGGSYADDDFGLWATNRQPVFPFKRGTAFGFRCGREDK